MKRSILILLAFSFWKSAYAQSQVDEYRTMIDSAIILQTKSLDIKHDVYLINEKDQPYFFLSPVNQKKFKSIDVYEPRNKKILRNGINAWKVLSKLQGNRLYINIIDFKIIYSKSNYNYSNGGGAQVIFEYSCDKNKWVLVNSKWRGI